MNAVELAARVAPVLATNARDVDQKARFPEESFAALADAGLLAGCATLTELARVCQVLSAACASTSLCYLMHCCGHAVLATSDAALATIAFGGEPHEDRVSAGCLWGRRPYVTGGDRVATVLVLVEDTMWAVPTNLPGTRFEGRWDGMGLRGNNSTVFVMDDVPLDRCLRIGDPGQGSELRQRIVRPMFLVGLAAIAVGIARAAVDDAARIVRRRPSPPERAHVEQAAVGALHAKVLAAGAQTLAAASAADSAADALESLLAAKLVACETAAEVTQATLRIAGGRGFAGGTDLDRYFRDAQSGPIMTPTNQEIQAVLGGRLFDRA